ncbi:hypothetical protein [Marinifilum flexuosum]|uniref:hypothetical protein n=1 Tax=Marinifilum flexuosum TaxID=1117708 RepID=UPI0024959C92|nr:hypothetical protein [Marinifilum flexuosum]
MTNRRENKSFEEYNPVAKIIIDQILCLDKSALMAWGAHDYVVLDSDSKQEGGIMLTVNGLKFQGQVEIRLQWNDTYTIRFLQNDTEIKRSENVYCDQLIEIIDWIEFGDGPRGYTTGDIIQSILD